MGSCLALRNKVSRDMCTDKQETLLGGRALGGEQEGEEPRRALLPHGLLSSAFMVMGFVSGLSLADYSYSGAFLVVQPSLSQDEFQPGFWEVGGTLF